MRTLFLCGAGNAEGVRLAMIVNRAEAKWDRLLVLDDDPGRHGHEVLGVAVAGGIVETLARAHPATDNVVNLVGRTTSGRSAVRKKILESGIPFARLIHPGVETLGVTFVGDDVMVYANATLCGGATLCEGSVVFMNAAVGHGATVKECAVVGPGSVLNARVVLSERAYFGTNASILPDLTIGEEATVGANSAVMEDVPAGATAIGVPAELLMHAKSARSPDDSSSVPPVPADAETIAAIRELWLEVLQLPELPANANFFDVGGSSLLALRLRERAQGVLGRPVSLLDVFRFPTVESFASALSSPVSGRGGAAASVGARRGEMRRRRLVQR